MKKLILFFALILAFNISSFAQSSGTSITDISMKRTVATTNVKFTTANKSKIILTIVKNKKIFVCKEGIQEGDIIKIYAEGKKLIHEMEMKTSTIKSGVRISKLEKGMPYLVEIKTKKGVEKGVFKL